MLVSHIVHLRIGIRTPMHKQPLVQTPPVRKLRRPRLERNSIANKAREMIIVQPADRLFVRLHANSDAVVACARLPLGLARSAGYHH
jgi:hypothetical protein